MVCLRWLVVFGGLPLWGVVSQAQTTTTTTTVPSSIWDHLLSKASLSKIHTLDHGKALTDWMQKTPDAFLNPKLALQRPNASLPHYAWYAIDDIAHDEVLMTIPRSMILQPDPLRVGDRVGIPVDPFNDDDEWHVATIETIQGIQATVVFDDDNSKKKENYVLEDLDHHGFCGIAQKLVHELKRGEKSPYAPYIQYLQSQPTGQLPDAWSPQGKALLDQIRGKDDEELPPAWQFYHLDDWHNVCHGATNDPMAEHAYMTVVQRGWDEVLIPVYDMMSHRNGLWLNSKSTHVRDGNAVIVQASRDIDKGEQIYTTYNHCEDCNFRYDTYGTPEILRDYGFVEQYPQRWIFHNQQIGFDVEENENDELFVEWMDVYPRPDANDVEFLTTQLLRLEELEESVLNHVTAENDDNNIPAHEVAVLKSYVHAFTVAIRTALQDLEVTSVSDDGEDEDRIADDDSDDDDEDDEEGHSPEDNDVDEFKDEL